MRKKIVTFGGGTGQPMLLRAVKSPMLDITAVVSMADSGGSSGVLRDELGVLPPSDALRCLLALADMNDPRAALLARACRERFTGEGSLVPNGIGHTTGNILLGTLLKQHGGEYAFGVMGQLLAVPHNYRVLPSTLRDVTLMAQLGDKTIICGETTIDIPESGSTRSPIFRVWLDPQDAQTTDVVIEAIVCANFVVVPPGDLYTSIIASLLPQGIKQAICKSKARVVMCANTMIKKGETDEYGVLRHVLVVEEYLGQKVDVVICNTGLPTQDVLERYAAEGKHPVEVDIPDSHWDGREVIKADLLARGELARHSPECLGYTLRGLFGVLE